MIRRIRKRIPVREFSQKPQNRPEVMSFPKELINPHYLESAYHVKRSRIFRDKIVPTGRTIFPAEKYLLSKTEELKNLRKLEKSSWKDLSLKQKLKLYHAEYDKPLIENFRKDDFWIGFVGLAMISLAFWGFFLKDFTRRRMEFSPKAGDFWHVWDPEWKILKDTPGAHSVFYESDMAGAKRDFVNWDYKKHGWKSSWVTVSRV